MLVNEAAVVFSGVCQSVRLSVCLSTQKTAAQNWCKLVQICAMLWWTLVMMTF